MLCKRVWLVGLWAATFVLLALPSLPAHAQSIKIVALGASNTQGHGVSPAQAYPAVLQGLLKAKGVDATVINAGIFGDTTGGMLARLDKDVPADTRIVILQPGGNDARKGQGTKRGPNIAAIGSKLAARNIKMVMMENDMLRAVPRSQVQADGIHFTPKGCATLAALVLPSVVAAIGK